jgi:hypothetical protein
MFPNLKGRHIPEPMTITLSSYSNPDYFAENTNQKFRNLLVNPIDIERPMEIGLVEFYHQPAPEKSSNIFGHHPDDNKITVIKREELDFQVAKQAGGLVEFIAFANIELKRFNIPIEFHIVSKKGVGHLIMYQNAKDRRAILSPEYASAFGFTAGSYSEGKHDAEQPFSNEAYNEIDITKKFLVKLVKDETHDLRVQEPATKDVIDLITAINNAMESFQITLVYDGETIEYENEHTYGALTQFSSLIEEIFNIPTGHWFVKKKETFPSFGNIDLGVTSNFINVSCNAIEPQHYNGTLMPILKMFQKPEIPNPAQLVQLKSNKVFYLPISKHVSTLDNLEIELLDEHLQPLKLAKDSHSTVVLQLRPQYY